MVNTYILGVEHEGVAPEGVVLAAAQPSRQLLRARRMHRRQEAWHAQVT